MPTYLVGGAVRDTLLNHPFEEKDWVVVGATPEQMLEQGFKPVGKDFPVFIHPDSGEEYALARTERKKGSGYTGFECFSSPDVTLEQDLLRRDLTINAMAQDELNNIIDPYGGQDDLENKILRHVSDAFQEDPLRVLRVARFFARYHHLGFTIAPETLELLKNISNTDELKTLTVERIWKEIEKALNTQTPSAFFQCLEQSNALEQLLPELSGLELKQLQLLDKAKNKKANPLVIFSLLLSGKSPQEVKTLCERLKAPNDFEHLASLFAKQACHIKNDMDAMGIMRLLEQLDAFRKPDRCQHFLTACELIGKDERTISTLKKALVICNNIDATEFILKGMKGPQIGNAIKKKRISLIEENIL